MAAKILANVGQVKKEAWIHFLNAVESKSSKVCTESAESWQVSFPSLRASEPAVGIGSCLEVR
jgi:hypothetical protein